MFLKKSINQTKIRSKMVREYLIFITYYRKLIKIYLYICKKICIKKNLFERNFGMKNFFMKDLV